MESILSSPVWQGVSGIATILSLIVTILSLIVSIVTLWYTKQAFTQSKPVNRSHEDVMASILWEGGPLILIALVLASFVLREASRGQRWTSAGDIWFLILSFGVPAALLVFFGKSKNALTSVALEFSIFAVLFLGGYSEILRYVKDDWIRFTALAANSCALFSSIVLVWVCLIRIGRRPNA
jgi:hypothetical protein